MKRSTWSRERPRARSSSESLLRLKNLLSEQLPQPMKTFQLKTNRTILRTKYLRYTRRFLNSTDSNHESQIQTKSKRRWLLMRKKLCTNCLPTCTTLTIGWRVPILSNAHFESQSTSTLTSWTPSLRLRLKVSTTTLIVPFPMRLILRSLPRKRWRFPSYWSSSDTSRQTKPKKAGSDLGM